MIILTHLLTKKCAEIMNSLTLLMLTNIKFLYSTPIQSDCKMLGEYFKFYLSFNVCLMQIKIIIL